MEKSIQGNDNTERTGVSEESDISIRDYYRDNKFWHTIRSTLLITFPIIAFGCFGCSNFNQISDQLVYIKYGGELGNTSVVNATCTASLNKTEEDKAQTSATEFRLYSKIGRCVAAFIFLPLWGAYTDRHGRHTAVIVGSVSAILYTIPLLLVALTDVVPLWILIVGDVIHGIFGNSTHLLLIACATYTADVFQEGNRILMMIIIDVVYLMANTAGQVGGGYWIQASGFVPIVICMQVSLSLVLLYGIFFFKKLTKSQDKHLRNPQMEFSVVQYFTKSYHTFMTARTGHTRAYLILTIMIVMTMYFPYYGITSVFTIYVIGPPLCWNSLFLGIFNGVTSAVTAVVPLIIGLVFIRISSRTTVWLVLLAAISDLIHWVLCGLASASLLMFISGVVGSLEILVTPAARTIISDLVDANEQGAALAGYTISTSLAELLSNPLFNAVFVATLSNFNTCVFFVAAGFDVVTLLLLGYATFYFILFYFVF